MARDGARTFVLRFLGDEGSAVNSLRRLHNETGKLDPANKVATNAISNLSSMLTSRLGPASGVASSAIKDKVGPALASLGPAGIAAAAGVAVGAAALIKFAVDGVGAFTNLAGQIRAFQRVSGASAEDASKLVGELKLLGVAPDEVSRAFGIFAKNVELNRDKFAQYGVVIAKNKDGTTDYIATLHNLADASNRAGAGTLNSTRAAELLGRGYQALLPLLLRGRDGLAALDKQLEARGLVFDQESLDKAKEFGLQMRELRSSVEGFKVAAGEALVPFLTDLAEAATKVVDFAHKLDFKNPSADLGGWLGDRIREFAGFSTAQDRAAEAGNGLAATEQEVADAAQEAADALTESTSALSGSASALLSYERSANSLTDSIHDLATAEKAEKDAPAEAARIREEAARKVVDADRSVEQAQKRLTQARKDAVTQLRDLDLANRENALSEQDAADAVTDAQEAILKAKTLEEQQDAERALARAKLAQERQRNQTGDDAERLADAQKKGVTHADPVVDARRALEQATRDAEQAEVDRAAAGEKADQIGAEAARKHRDAVLGVQGAYIAAGEEAGKLAVLGSEVLDGVLSAEDKQRIAFEAKTKELERLRDTLAPDAPLRVFLNDTLAALDKASGSSGTPGGSLSVDERKRVMQEAIDGLGPPGGPVLPNQRPNVTIAAGAIVNHITGDVSDAQRRQIEAAIQAGIARATQPGGPADRNLGGG